MILAGFDPGIFQIGRGGRGGAAIVNIFYFRKHTVKFYSKLRYPPYCSCPSGPPYFGAIDHTKDVPPSHASLSKIDPV